MNPDSGIICFQHCTSKSIFCREIPSQCPLCDSKILGYILDPFKVPYPFGNASHNPTTIVVRPTHGNFLNNYKVTDDLHIGIVNSKGCVIEFDKLGVIIDDRSKWTDCLIFTVIPESWESHWDDILETTSKDLKWSSCDYHEDTMNCFNFVIEFLKKLQYKDMIFIDKVEMCEKFILPKIREVLRYISIHRKLNEHDSLIIN